MDNIQSSPNNLNVLDRCHSKLKVIAVKSAAAGDLANEKVKICRICKDNGWPHEAITFERVLGRVLSDGHNETKGWIVRDYFTGQIHLHRCNKQE
ncbi:MAG: hypothetical protein WA395_05645 [Nitrososphaeraceae archaeon]